jgi:hypothetical protein
VHVGWWIVGVLGGALLASVSAPAQELGGHLSAYGQVREGDQTRDSEAPSYVYGDLALRRLRHGTELGTVFQLGRDFGADDGTSDVYAGYARVPAAPPGLDVTGGRQFLNGALGGVYVMDGGQARFDAGWPVAFSVFGGKPEYFEPTFSSPLLSDDEVVFGGSVSTARWRGGQLALGYLQLERADHVLRQLVSATASRSFLTLPGLPRLYGSVGFDADRPNLDQGSAGLSLLIPGVRAQWNVEGTYYQPQDHDERLPTPALNRREDPIFELFAASEMVQWRSGLYVPLVHTVAALIDYAFQHYDHIEGDERENSHVARAGLIWLPGGDGLEVVRAEYYAIDSDGGRVNGGKGSYESRVYERLLFVTRIDVSTYDKVRNEGDTAISGLIGLGYELLPGLVCELDFEANRNDRFDDDFRFGFAIDYNFRHRRARPQPGGGAS